MNIFPSNLLNNNITNNSGTINNQKGYKDILFDTEKKKIVLSDGKNIFASKKEQVKQWIYLLINTEIDKYNVYKNTDFGIRFLYEMRGHEYYSSGYTIAQIKHELTQKILENKSIEKIENIDITIEFNKMIIAITILLEGEKEEVIYNV